MADHFAETNDDTTEDGAERENFGVHALGNLVGSVEKLGKTWPLFKSIIVRKADQKKVLPEWLASSTACQ